MVKNQSEQLNWLLYLFVSIHVTAWTLIPFAVRFTLPMDSMEGTIWGQQFEWGYDKNPFLNGWLTALAIHISGASGWAVYLFSQLSVAVCFLATWLLAKKILPPVYAIVAVLLLDGIQYYNLHAIDFNDNTLELGLWALTALFFYQGLRHQTWYYWLLTGIFSGLGMMAKYYTVMLLVPMMLFLIFHPQNRKTFTHIRSYLGLLAFVLMIAPHTVWLFFHDFVTVNYAFDRVSHEPDTFNHFNFAALFTWQQFETLIPFLCLGLLLFVGKKPLTAQPRIPINSFDKQFLLYVGLGPFLLTILLSALTGIKLRAGWGQPLLSLWGIMFLAWLQPSLTLTKFYRVYAVFVILLVVTVVSYAAALIRAPEPSSANFPGKKIAETLTKEWTQSYHTPLTYVAGSRWLAGNIALYSANKPAVYINWDKKLSPWIEENKLKTQGGIFVWDSSEGNEAMPAEIKARFPNLSPLQVRHFSWLRNKTMKPVEIGVAFLPPQLTNPQTIA